MKRDLHSSEIQAFFGPLKIVLPLSEINKTKLLKKKHHPNFDVWQAVSNTNINNNYNIIVICNFFL